MLFVLDCDNFFASCEKLFRPDLANQPLIVLSNNDGCVIARSTEAKILNIQMGAPYFMIQELVKEYNIKVFSANFALYSNLSDRVMAIARKSTPTLEIYSIDEAFGTLDHLKEDEIQEAMTELSDTVLREVGIPVSIGVAPTKVLAKIATHLLKNTKKHIARKYHSLHGHFPQPPKNSQVEILSNSTNWKTKVYPLPVSEVWGIGTKLADRLARQHITTCGQLVATPTHVINKLLGITGLRIQQELTGTSCFEVNTHNSSPQSIVNSRSFGKPISSFADVSQAVTRFTEDGARKLRKHSLVASEISIYITTKRYDTRPFSAYKKIILNEPTNNTRLLISEAQQLLFQCFASGYTYRKAAVSLHGLFDQSSVTAHLFDEYTSLPTSSDKILDTINKRVIHIRSAAAGITPTWVPKGGQKSPHYTTRLSEVPRVK